MERISGRAFRYPGWSGTEGPRPLFQSTRNCLPTGWGNCRRTRCAPPGTSAPPHAGRRRQHSWAIIRSACSTLQLAYFSAACLTLPDTARRSPSQGFTANRVRLPVFWLVWVLALLLYLLVAKPPSDGWVPPGSAREDTGGPGRSMGELNGLKELKGVSGQPIAPIPLGLPMPARRHPASTVTQKPPHCHSPWPCQPARGSRARPCPPRLPARN